MADPASKVPFHRLASGVLTDVRNLSRESADLFRQLAKSSQNTGRTGSLLIAGAGTVLVGAILLCVMLVYLLAWVMPGQPVWISYAAIGLPVLATGIGLIMVARRRMNSLEPVHQHSAKVLRDATETAEHVGEAAEAARQSLNDTAETLREVFDLNGQFNKRPWALMAGAVSLGYLGGAILKDGASPIPSESGDKSEHSAVKFARLFRQFEPEIAQLQTMALRAFIGIVSNSDSKSAPQKPREEIQRHQESAQSNGNSQTKNEWRAPQSVAAPDVCRND